MAAGNGHYDLSEAEIVATIRKHGAKRVLVQLPDGLKPHAERIQRIVRKELPDVELVFWGGSAFGSCDVPLGAERLGFDLLLHLGHAPWR